MAPTAAAALVASTVAVAVNLATEWKTSWWAWLAVVALTVISGGVSLWLYRRQDHADSSLGAGDVSVGGNVGTLNYYVAAVSAAVKDTTPRDASSPQPALPMSVSGRRDHRRRRWQLGLAIAVAGVTYPTYLLFSPPARDDQENVDRPTTSAVSAGHDAHADFYRQDRQFKIYDDRRDGRSAILQVKINGTLLDRPWYNIRGRTDATHPPEVQPLGFDSYATVEYRVCVGKAKDRDKPLDEKSCGQWVIDRAA